MVQLKTYTRAIQVIPSAYCDIPNPSLLIVEGITTSSEEDKLICSNVNFNALGVQAGDIVYVPTNSIGATVVSVFDSETLILSTQGQQPAASVAFIIYAGNQNYSSKSGCVLYSADASELLGVTTVGGDVIDINLFANQIAPIQVRSVSVASNPVLALW